MVHTPITPDSDAGQLIERLGYAGLIPFVVLALFLFSTYIPTIVIWNEEQPVMQGMCVNFDDCSCLRN